MLKLTKIKTYLVALDALGVSDFAPRLWQVEFQDLTVAPNRTRVFDFGLFTGIEACLLQLHMASNLAEAFFRGYLDF